MFYFPQCSPNLRAVRAVHRRAARHRSPRGPRGCVTRGSRTALPFRPGGTAGWLRG